MFSNFCWYNFETKGERSSEVLSRGFDVGHVFCSHDKPVSYETLNFVDNLVIVHRICVFLSNLNFGYKALFMPSIFA